MRLGLKRKETKIEGSNVTSASKERLLESFLYHTVIGVDAEINGISSEAVGRYADVDTLRIVVGYAALVVVEVQVKRVGAVGIGQQSVYGQPYGMVAGIIVCGTGHQEKCHVKVTPRGTHPHTLEAYGVGFQGVDTMGSER